MNFQHGGGHWFDLLSLHGNSGKKKARYFLGRKVPDVNSRKVWTLLLFFRGRAMVALLSGKVRIEGALIFRVSSELVAVAVRFCAFGLSGIQ